MGAGGSNAVRPFRRSAAPALWLLTEKARATYVTRLARQAEFSETGLDLKRV